MPAHDRRSRIFRYADCLKSLLQRYVEAAGKPPSSCHGLENCFQGRLGKMLDNQTAPKAHEARALQSLSRSFFELVASASPRPQQNLQESPAGNMGKPEITSFNHGSLVCHPCYGQSELEPRNICGSVLGRVSPLLIIHQGVDLEMECCA